MWDLVDLRFEEEEEAKKIASADNLLDRARIFETHTVATLSTKEKASCSPKVCCVSSQLYVVIAVGSQVFLLREGTFERICSLNLDTHADCLALSEDSQLLLIGESSGILHVLHVTTQEKLWSLPLVKPEDVIDCAFKSVLFRLDDEGLMKICVLTGDEKLFIFSSISSTELYKAIEDGCMNNIKNAIQRKEICLPVDLPGFRVQDMYENFADDDRPVGLAGGKTVSFECDFDDDEYFDYEVTVLNSCFSEEESLLKAQCTKNGRYVVALNSKHQLEIICPDTLGIVKQWNSAKVLDFVLKETVDPNSLAITDSAIGLLTQTTSGNITGAQFSYEMYLFPSFELIYSVNLKFPATLASCKSNQDCIYIIEKACDNSETKGLISSLHVKVVSESSREARLSSLLNKRKFEEAENFARLHRLDSQIIYKTKISGLLEDLSSKILSASTAEIDKIIKEIQSILFKVEDIVFIESCLSVRLPSLKQTKGFFSICRKWLGGHSADSKRKEKLMAKMNKTLNKALTYEILSETNGLRNMQWGEFVVCDLQSRFIHELALGNMNTAFLLWRRHQGDMSSLTIDLLEEILSAIPDSVTSDLLIPFLSDEFIPFVISELPESLEKVVDWLIQRTYVLEISEKENWPENGKHLLEVFNVVSESLSEGFYTGKICFSTNLQLYSIPKLGSITSSPISRLFMLIQSLEELIVLKKQYGCHLSLSEYCQEDKISVVYFMLDRVEPSLIGLAVDKIIRNFIMKHNLDLDVCLIHYIKDVLQTTPYTWWHWEEAPWEERILKIVKCVQDIDCWMDVVLNIVFQAPIPWSAGIQELVQIGLEHDHPKKEQLKTQSRLVGLKQTLMKYDLRDFPINGDTGLAEVLVKYIFQQEKPSSWEDVKTVYHAYEMLPDDDAYMSYLNHLLSNKKLNAIVPLLMSMPRATAVCCCKRLLRTVVFTLDDEFSLKVNKDHTKAVAQAGVLLMRFLNSMNEPIDSETQFAISVFIKLQEEFNMWIPIHNFSSTKFCWNVVIEAMNSHLAGNFVIQQNFEGKKSILIKPGVHHIYRLGDILNLKREEVMTRLIYIFVEHHNYDSAVKLCRYCPLICWSYCSIVKEELQELVQSYPTPSSADTLMIVVNQFFEQFERIQKIGLGTIIETIHHLMSIAVTYCSESYLKWPLWQHISVLNTISQLTIRETQLSSMSAMGSRSYHKWKFSPLYSDEGLWVDESKIVSLFDKEYARNKQIGLSENISSNEEAILKILKLCKDLTLYMRQKGQEIVALRILMHSLSFSIACLKQNSQDAPVSQVLLSQMTTFEETTFSILQKAIDQRNPDVPFILGNLNILPKVNTQAAFKRLVKWASTDVSRTLTLYSVAVIYSLDHGNADMASKFSKSYDKLLWFSKHSMPIHSPQDIINFSYAEELNLIKETIVTRNIDLNTVFECCTIFSLDPDDVLYIYLKNLLLGNEVKQWSKYPELPQNLLQVLLRRAEIVITEFKTQEVALTYLKQILEEVNTYHYEILLFVHEQILKISENFRSSSNDSYKKGATLLKFLLVYKRVSPPTESEVDEWLTDNLVDGNLPAIARSRLPFRALMKGSVHKIINPELTISTATVWITLASFLKLSHDELIMIAIKNTVTKYISQKRTSSDSQVINFTPDVKFLSLLRDLLSKIENPEMSVACASWITNRMPSGANKVQAAKGAVMLAKNWVQISSSEKKIMDAFKKLNHHHLRLAIELVLHRYNLSNEECLSLLPRPVHLIEHLVENCCIPVYRSLRVCQAVQEIADIVEIDVRDIFYGYLCRWLAPSQIMTQCADESFYMMGPSASVDPTENMDRKNMQKAICFLLGTTITCQKELFRLLFLKFAGNSTMHRARSLCCLLSVADPEFVSEITEIEYSTLMQHLKLLMSVSELESMRLPYSVEMFYSCSKSELVERILTSHAHSPKALITCVKICLEYKLWHSHIWIIILQKMKSMLMVEELHNCLNASSNNLSHIWHCDQFTNAWHCVISSIVEKNSELEGNEIIRNMCSTLLRCPGSALLDVSVLSEKLKYNEAIPPNVLDYIPPDLNMSSFILLLSRSIAGKLSNDTVTSFFYPSDGEDEEDAEEEETKYKKIEHADFFPHLQI